MTKIRFVTVAMTFSLCMVAFTSKTMAKIENNVLLLSGQKKSNIYFTICLRILVKT